MTLFSHFTDRSNKTKRKPKNKDKSWYTPRLAHFSSIVFAMHDRWKTCVTVDDKDGFFSYNHKTKKNYRQEVYSYSIGSTQVCCNGDI